MDYRLLRAGYARSYLACLLFLPAVAASPGALADAYPSHPVRIIVPFGPSGGTDLQGRAIGEQLSKQLGEAFVVDNHPGASGLIGAQMVVDAPPDGYTILFTTASLAVNTTLYRDRMKFSPTKDLAPLTWTSSAPLVLVVQRGVPADSVRQLVELAKNKANRLTAGCNGIGTTSHLSAEMFKQMAKVNYLVVPYKGGGPALVGLLRGETDFLFATVPSAAPHIRAHKLKALAVTTQERSSAFPELPTMDSIYPGFVSDNWYAMFVPTGTPKAIVDTLNSNVREAMKAPEVVKFMQDEGLDPVASTPNQLTQLLTREITKYAAVIRDANIKLAGS